MPKHYTAPETKVPYCYYEHTRDLKGFQFISLDNVDTTPKPRSLKGADAMYFASVITESLERNPEAGEQKLRAFQEQLYRNIEKGLLENTISEFIKDKKKAEQKSSFQTTQEDMKVDPFHSGREGRVRERERESIEKPTLEIEPLQKEESPHNIHKSLLKGNETDSKLTKDQGKTLSFQVTQKDMDINSLSDRLAKKERIKILERERIEKIKLNRTRDFGRDR